MITDTGVIIRITLDQVTTLKRATQGVRLINLKDNCFVSTIAIVRKEDNEENQNEEDTNNEEKGE